MQSELEMLEEFEENGRYLSEHFDELQKNYQEEFVAIYKKNFVWAAKQLDEVIAKLKEKGIDPGFVLIEFIPKKGITILY
ncbi:MAG: DUF5678 domain-containing protein [Candidatus Aenigmarchaeota archaeon]|nr:DUF5678 domain-containing protein [Candidatus Aenigmarchaeota archaeon]